MKEALLPSPCPENARLEGLSLSKLSFLGNGPYEITVAPGECVGLTGRSGVGKTQLLRAVADVIVHEGDCVLDSNVCSSMPAPEWRRRVAMLPAESFWWYDSVGAHFPSESGGAGFEDLFGQLGFPLEVLGWQVSRLSTGERQRLALVRLLMNKPRVLLLDEPTSALDNKMVHVVEEIIADICSLQEVICLWVSHDLEQLARVADRVFQVEASGFTEESVK